MVVGETLELAIVFGAVIGCLGLLVLLQRWLGIV